MHIMHLDNVHASLMWVNHIISVVGLDVLDEEKRPSRSASAVPWNTVLSWRSLCRHRALRADHLTLTEATLSWSRPTAELLKVFF